MKVLWPLGRRHWSHLIVFNGRLMGYSFPFIVQTSGLGRCVLKIGGENSFKLAVTGVDT